MPTSSHRLSRLAIFLLLTAVAIPLAWAAEQEQTVATVVDGDTITLGNGDKVRLLGIDTPETVHPSKPIEAFGREASEFAKKHLANEKVRLVLDPVNTAINHRDKYGRLLAYVHRTRDGFDFNAEAVRQGYAHAYTKFPFGRMEEFRGLEKDARENKRGLWGPQPIAVVSDAVFVTKSGTKYHRAGCRHLSKSAIEISRDEAIGKYTACDICNP